MLFGDKIKYLRSIRGLTQEDLAYMSDTSIKSIQRAEKNVQVSLDIIRRIANALDYDYDSLLSERNHLAEIKREFSTQANNINTSDLFNNNQFINNILSVADIEPSDKVLDLACGTGILTKHIGKITNHVTAIDITDKMIDITKSACITEGLDHVEVVKGNAEKLPFENCTYDKIITRLSIHHFKNPDRILKEMKRVLKDDGHIIISDIYTDDDISEKELHNAIEQLRDPTHVRALSLSEFDVLFEANSLDILDAVFFSFQREFDEWLKITNAPERYKPLFVILKNLVQSGKLPSINLKMKNNKIYFKHNFATYKLEK